MKQQIRFCKSFDGARIAYATMGSGPAIVKAPHWLTHLEHEAESPVWKPWLEEMSRGNTLVRMDERNCGLSDWDVEISFEHWVRDLEAVVDAAGLERFALFGHSQGASISIEYAARHPERVTHLLILGGYLRGTMRRGLPQHRIDELEATLKLVEVGWGRDDVTYRQMFAMSFIPGATLEQINSLSELQRKSASPKGAVAIMRAFFNIEASASAPKVKCPTLLIHGRDDRRAPMEEGRLIASLIPGARSHASSRRCAPLFRTWRFPLWRRRPRRSSSASRRSSPPTWKAIRATCRATSAPPLPRSTPRARCSNRASKPTRAGWSTWPATRSSPSSTARPAP
jgi:pimeloyl-ACP methyl ester carboxylesterase